MSITKDIFIWTKNLGLLRGTFIGSPSNGVSTAIWRQLDKRQPTNIPCFSSAPFNPCSPTLGASRADLSIQIASCAEKQTYPVVGLTTNASSSTLTGVSWFETGSKVKNIKDGLWLGLSTSTARNGYLWIANATFSNFQQELSPNTALVRGDTTVPNLGTASDFDVSLNGDRTLLAIVYKNLGTSKLGFILYNTANNTITHERVGADVLVGSTAAVDIAYTPRISYNPTYSSWTIVAQDDTRSGGQFVCYRRTVGGTWYGERVGVGGDTPSVYTDLATNMGKKPAVTHYADGSVIVASETSSFGALVSKRNTSGTWSKIFVTPTGFREPQIIKTLDGQKYWIFGDTKVASSPLAWDGITQDWSLFSPSVPTLVDSGYTTRTSLPVPMALTSSVIVATAAKLSGSVPDYRELLVWNFNNAGFVLTVGAFTARGRLQATYNDEEDSLSDLSWTSNGSLLYAAQRPLRANQHWSIRGSSDWTNIQGESLLGAGRNLTVASRHFREQFFSASDPLDIIHEYTAAGSYLTSRGTLPLAQRTSDYDLLSLKWRAAATSGSLFTQENFTDDTSLPSGAIQASSSRGWPIILGTTKLNGRQVGAAVYFQGAMLGLYPPQGVSNLTYFNSATIGSGNLFKLEAQKTLTLKGTHIWWLSPTRKAVLVGPLSLMIDPSFQGKHLIFEFPHGVLSPVIQPSDNYWSALNQDAQSTIVPLGEVLDFGVVLYPLKKDSIFLHHGTLEPKELLAKGYAIEDWCYTVPDIERPDDTPKYVALADGGIALKDISSMHGIQTIPVGGLIVHKQGLPNKGWIICQAPYVGASTNTTIAF